jgi:hypothetical protein
VAGYNILKSGIGPVQFHAYLDQVKAGTMTPADFKTKVTADYKTWSASDVARVWNTGYAKVPQTNATPTTDAYNALKDRVELYAQSIKEGKPVKSPNGTYFAPMANNSGTKDPFSAAGNASFLQAPGAGLMKAVFKTEQELKDYRDALAAGNSGLSVDAIGSPDTGLEYGAAALYNGKGQPFIDAIFNSVGGIGDAMGSMVGGGDTNLLPHRSSQKDDDNIEYEKDRDGKLSLGNLLDHMLYRSVGGNGRSAQSRFAK